VFVRDMLGHAKLTTTDRYLAAKYAGRGLLHGQNGAGGHVVGAIRTDPDACAGAPG
jgi:hypothetical protein